MLAVKGTTFHLLFKSCAMARNSAGVVGHTINSSLYSSIIDWQTSGMKMLILQATLESLCSMGYLLPDVNLVGSSSNISSGIRRKVKNSPFFNFKLSISL